MSRVELVFDRSCPNVDEARAQIREALSVVGLPPSWSEWDRDSDTTPQSLRPFGSPTILVDGRDVSGPNESGNSLPVANSCRIYTDAKNGVSGVPALELIVTALQDLPR